MLRFSESGDMDSQRFAFGDVTLDVGERRATLEGRPIALAPKAFDLLVYLVRHAGRLVTKRELMDAVWSDACVEEGILAVHVSRLRRELGDERGSARYIQTVSKSGYRFVGDVTSPLAAKSAGRSASAEVHELVGRARAHVMTSSRSELPAACRDFEAAIEIDGAYEAAHAGLALAYCAQAELRLMPHADAFALARTSALRALALDSTSADALTALGAVMFMAEWDWIGAERSLQRALEHSPNHTQARLLYGRLLDAQGRLQDGLATKLRALETDPFSASVHLAIALSYWNQRQYDECIRWATKTLDLDPSHGLAREFLAGAYWALGDFPRHMAENKTHALAHGVAAEAFAPVEKAFADGGRPAVIRFALDQAAQGKYRLPDMQLALFHGELGDLDSALPYLERAIATRDPCMVDIAVAPQWDVLRSDARFDQCLRTMGLRI